MSPLRRRPSSNPSGGSSIVGPPPSRFLRRCRSGLGQQSAFFHNHYKWTRRVGGRHALEVECGSFFGHESGRDWSQHVQFNIGSLLLDIVLAGGDFKLGGGGRNDNALHLEGQAFDNIPNFFRVFGFASGEHQFPLGEA